MSKLTTIRLTYKQEAENRIDLDNAFWAMAGSHGARPADIEMGGDNLQVRLPADQAEALVEEMRQTGFAESVEFNAA